MKNPQGLKERISEALLFSVPLFLVNVYFKYTYLNFGGLEIARRAYPGQSVTLLDLASFFARDFVEGLIIFPLLLLGLGILFGPIVRAAVNTILLELLILAGVVGWATYHTMGTFPNVELIRDFIHAYKIEPETVAPTSFLSAWQQIKIAVVIVVGFIPLLVFAVPRLKRVAYLALSSTASYSLLAFITLSAGVLSYLPETITSYHAGQLQRVTLEMFRSERLAFPVQPKANVKDLVALYEKTAYPRGFPREKTPVPWEWQAESLPNIVLVIIETAPYRDVMTPSFEAQLPRIAALRPRALFAHQHFTTSPYSVRSVFSQLTGMYDLPTRKMIADFLMLDDHPSRLDSLPIVLGKLGYESVYYFPLALTHPNEEWMLKYLGFSRIVTGDIGGEGFHSQANMQLKRAREEQMFTRAIADVKTSAAKKQPFLYVLMTSLGHEPIVDIRPEDERLADPNPPRSLIVHNLLGMIDSLTGELLDALKETKLFENTIFIVTADHGVRNRLNDPELDLRFANHFSYHVPLLIHYPPVFDKAYEVPYVTSHIDLTPTVLSLMGIETEGLLHQGLPIFDKRINDRVSFFLGGHYFGINALYYDGMYYMYNDTVRLGFKNKIFSFGAENMVPDIPAESFNFKAKIDDIIKVQTEWIAYLRARFLPEQAVSRKAVLGRIPAS